VTTIHVGHLYPDYLNIYADRGNIAVLARRAALRGHQLEVQNYAVIGDLLYDLTPGHRRKVALAELDLTATATQNDDRGVVFQLPHPQDSGRPN